MKAIIVRFPYYFIKALAVMLVIAIMEILLNLVINSFIEFAS